jgi:hypothetical protein
LGVVSALGCVTSHEPEPTAEAEIANGGGGQAQCLPELIATRATPRQAIAGVIHREDLVDAVNLSLESDGSARLAIFGCDFCGEESPARWQPDGEDVLVLPREGDAHLAWYDDEGLEAAVSEVRLSRRPDGRIDAEVTSALSTYVQVWLDDRVCAKCCSGLGPTGLFLCDSPLPVEPCDQNVTWSCSADCEVATLTAG